MRTRLRSALPSMGVLWLLLLAPALSANTHVRASLAADTIPVGGYTQLSIEVEGSTRVDVNLPTLDGVILRNSGTSQSTSIANGRVTRSATLRITVLGEKQGSYTIPPIPVIVNGETFETQALTLQVDDSAAAQTKAAGSQAGQGSSTEGLSAADIRKISRLRITTPNTPIYVGQKVPLQVELWVNTAHRFDNLAAPATRNEHILLEALGQDFEQSIQYEDSDRFEVYQWNTSFTAIKEGTVPLQFATEVTVLVRARRPARAFDSIFDSDFFSPSHRRVPLLIQSDPQALEVRPLPSHAPDTFSGAIGQFQLATRASPLSVNQGDPITLDIELSGEGNFDRVFHSGLEADSGFRTYQPEAQWEPDSSHALQGVKTFKQAIIPRDAAITEIPPLQFSFFDPQSGSYETLVSTPLTIQVSGTAAERSAAGRANKEPSTGLVRIESDGWIPLQLTLDSSSAARVPMVQRSGAWALVVLSPPALCLLAWLLPLWIQRNRKTRLHRLYDLKRSLRAHDKELDQVQRSGDAASFVRAATRKSRAMLGCCWSIAPESITSADAKTRLGDAYPAIRHLLEQHNAMQYAGGIAPHLDIDPTRKALDLEWKQLIDTLEKS